jgi:hypothetical protein
MRGTGNPQTAKSASLTIGSSRPRPPEPLQRARHDPTPSPHDRGGRRPVTGTATLITYEFGVAYRAVANTGVTLPSLRSD